jgi:hypothetical protein
LALLRTYGRLGKVRDGFEVGEYDRNSGLEPSSVDAVAAELEALPRSYSSQSYVRASPLPSLADAVSVNGVLIGMVKAPGVLTVGTALPVATLLPHVAPEPDVTNAVISFRLWNVK